MVSLGDEFLVFGHRGLPEKFTENTLDGFLGAMDAGLDGIELDVQITKDNELIIYHDSYLEISGEKKHPWNMDLYEIKEITLDRGEKIPTLNEVLGAIKDYKIIIELKTVNERMESVNKGIEETLNKTISNYDSSNFLFVSFDPRTMMELKSMNNKLFCGWNIAVDTIRLLGNFSASDVTEIGLDYLQPSFDVFTDREILEFIENGLPVIVWTVNYVDTAMHLKNIGVNGIITDRGEYMADIFLHGQKDL